MIGGAQVWRGQTVLQHGSMQFQPNLGLHHSVFGGQDPSILKSDTLEKPFQTISDSEIIAALTLAAATHFGVSFHEEATTVSEWNAIQKHINLPPQLNACGVSLIGNPIAG